MAIRRTYTFDVSCPANTPASAPVSVDVSFRASRVEWIQIVIPDGHSGLTGIALAQGHGQVLPATAGQFIEGNDEEPRFEFTDLLGNGNWQALLYNQDTIAQPWQIRFEVAIPQPAGIVGPAIDQAAADQLAGALSDLGAAAGPGSSPDPSGAGDGLPPPPAPDDTGGLPPDVVPEPVPPDTTPDTPLGPVAEPVPPEPTDTGLGNLTPPDGSAPPLQTPTDGTPPATPGRVSGGGGRISGQPPGTRPAVRYVTKYKSEPVYRTVSLPAGGWLPEGARFTIRRIDQGQDFITNWRGEIIAPGDGYVIENLADQPFPNGFGPHYPVVHITSGEWAGGEYYIGHCTSAVNAGQRFRAGTVLAHADQGAVEGGGWVELGPRSALGAGIHGQGAELAGKWGTVQRRIQTGVRQTPYKVREVIPPAGAHRKPPAPHAPAPPAAKRAPAGAGGQATRPPAAHRGAPEHRPAPAVKRTGPAAGETHPQTGIKRRR